MKEDWPLELELEPSVRALHEVLGTPLGEPIPKRLVLEKLYEKYGMYPQHVPLRCNRMDECLHLRTTIESVNNVTSYKVQKLAFDYYDLNRNGVIDEEDLMRMLQKGLEMPAVDSDYQRILDHLRRHDNKVRDVPQLSPARSRGSPGLGLSRLSRISNPTHTDEASQESDRRPSPEIWTLLRRESEPPSQALRKLPTLPPVAFSRQPNKQVAINFHRFQEIFRCARPEIFYDILKFLFGYERRHKAARFETSRKKSRREPRTEPEPDEPPTGRFRDLESVRSWIKVLRTETLQVLQPAPH